MSDSAQSEDSAPDPSGSAFPVPWFLARARDDVIVAANSHLQDLLGIDRDDIVGRPWTDLCYEPGADDRTMVLEAGDMGLELQFKTADGDPLWVSARVGPGDADGEPAHGFAVLDVEDRRALEDTLAESAAELTEMAAFPEMNPGPVLRVDRRGTIVLANATAREVFGGERLEGNSWLDLCPGMTEDLWNEIRSRSESTPVEAQLGDRSLVFTHSRVSDDRYVFVYGTDLTNQRTAERALQQSERMATLGTLSAGLAHELNNPAAAARRSAEQLRGAFAKLSASEFEITQFALTNEQTAVMAELDERARARAAEPVDISATARGELEEQLEEFLEEYEVAESWDIAPSLVEFGFDVEALRELAAKFDSDQVDCIFVWLARRYEVHSLMEEIGHGAERVAEIVNAMRAYTYLDQAPVQNVDVHEGINNTLIILSNKLKAGISVHREYNAALPKIEAYGSELNQVWTNLIDNAVHAMQGKGDITLRTDARDGRVVVEVEDSGSGIPEDIQGRIFDPFFTTKAPGEGTGLGLNNTYNVVQKHGGSIVVESEPGRTVFTVELPTRLETSE